MTLSRQRLLAFLFPLLLSAPFLGRAYFVDDSYFVEIARWLVSNPAQPYHFRTDDAAPQSRGWEENGFVRMVNPLLHHYYLAALIKVGGEREAWLRLGCLLLSCLSALLVFELARRWVMYPLVTTCLAFATPAQWLSAHSLLIDPTMALFFLLALYGFVRALEVDSLAWMVVSGLGIGAALLSKYPSVLIIPITAIWLALRWKKAARPWTALVAWGIGLGALVMWSLWTAELYGRPHILAASGRMVQVYGAAKVLTFFLFFSGATLLPLIAWPTASRAARTTAAVTGVLITLLMVSPLGGFSWGQAALIALWATTGPLFLAAFWQMRGRWVWPRDPFLAVWLLGFSAMMLLVMGWVAGRYYVMATPAIAMAAARLVEIRWGENAQAILRIMLIVLVAFTGLLVVADYQQAATTRRLIADLNHVALPAEARRFYLGDSFTMSYMKDEGWEPCFPETVFRPGDIVIGKQVTMPLVWFGRLPIRVADRGRFDYPSFLPLKVMDHAGSAGFYASVWGALPFSFSGGPWESFRLFEILSDARSEPRAS